MKKNLFKYFKNIKDYFYNAFILRKKNKDDLIINIEKINLILKKEQKIFDYKTSPITCRFFSFGVYLIQEIIKYANFIYGTYDLIKNTKNAIDVISYKLNSYQKNYSK